MKAKRLIGLILKSVWSYTTVHMETTCDFLHPEIQILQWSGCNGIRNQFSDLQIFVVIYLLNHILGNIFRFLLLIFHLRQKEQERLEER